MAVPTYNELMLPLLKYASDGEEHHIHDATTHIANELQLSKEDQEELVSGARRIYKFLHRLGWAKTYLKKAG